MVRSTPFFYAHLLGLLGASDKTLRAWIYLLLHSAVKGSISLLYIDHPQDPTVTCCTTCTTGFPWKRTRGAGLGLDCTNGFRITLNFKEHPYQLPKVTVKKSCLAFKMLRMAPCWGPLPL